MTGVMWHRRQFALHASNATLGTGIEAHAAGFAEMSFGHKWTRGTWETNAIAGKGFQNGTTRSKQVTHTWRKSTEWSPERLLVIG